MTENERRKHPRVRIMHPVFYECFDKEGKLIGQNLGSIIDISNSGIMIKTEDVVESNFVLLTSVDLKNKLFEIRGKVIHCKKKANGEYVSGIKFQETEGNNIRFTGKIVAAYLQNKLKSGTGSLKRETAVRQ